MMTSTGPKELTSGLHAKPTTYQHGSYSHRSNIKYNFTLKIYHTASGRRNDIGWRNYPGAILRKYLQTLGQMLLHFQHTALLNPSQNEWELHPIPLADITKATQEGLIEKYMYNIHYSESGNIQSFETHITLSYAELGGPPRDQTIEGPPEARNYAHSLQQNLFGVQKQEKTIHGNLPCMMLINSIRREDDYRIKTDILSRLLKSNLHIAVEHFDALWVNVYSPNTKKKNATKCITIPLMNHSVIPQVIHAINTQQSKTDYPNTYNYRAIAITPLSNAINKAIEDQALFTRSLTSVSLTDHNKMDIYCNH
jgi:hypothetical protein